MINRKTGNKSAMTQAIEYLRDHPADFVPQATLLKDISQRTGYSMESVRGSVCKSSKKGLYSLSTQRFTGFSPAPRTKTRPAGFVRTSAPPKIAFQDYACPDKDKIRDLIIDFARKRILAQSPRIMTFASQQGLCVKRFREVWPESRITNVERDPDIYKKYRRLKLGTVDLLAPFAEAKFHERFDLLNYDANAYLSNTMAIDIARIAEESLADNVALTMQYSRHFRNTGAWVTNARKKYGKLADPLKACVEDLLPGYRLVAEHTYRKTNVHMARRMRTFLFERTL